MQRGRMEAWRANTLGILEAGKPTKNNHDSSYLKLVLVNRAE